jgi:rhodanese-related sulfurtransferase
LNIKSNYSFADVFLQVIAVVSGHLQIMVRNMYINKKNIWQMAVIIIASVVCGLGSNFFAEKPLPLFKALAEPGPLAGAVSFSEADADIVRQLSADPGTVLIDARVPELFKQGHIPGAISLPMSRFDELIGERRAQLQAARLLVVYCSGPNCQDSYELALKLWGKGFKDLLLYRGGIEDWLEKGNVVAK